MTLLAAPKPPSIKGWCPGALRPMRSGDGLVVRLRLADGVLSAPQARAIAGLSRSHGNGRIDLTQRANLQLRGVSDATWPDLIDRLAALDLVDTDAELEAVSNIIVSPLAGLDPRPSVDAHALAAGLRVRLADDPAFRALPGKFGFVVDDGGALSLDDVGTDIRFLGDHGRVAVEIGALWRLGLIDASEAPDAASRLVGAFRSLRGSGPNAPRRMQSLIAAMGAEAVARAAGFDPSGVQQRAPRPEPSVIGERDGFVGLGVPFDRLTADDLATLADAAAGDIRLTPWRAMLLPGADASALAGLDRAGFITSPEDARLAVVACPGAPECDSGADDVRRTALALSSLAAKLPGTGVRLHVSGCAKGCARPQATAVTLIARGATYDLVLNGRAGDEPVSTGSALQAIESVLRTPKATGPLMKPHSDRASYIRDGAEIYRHSFAIIRAEADLARFTPSEEPLAVRIIHACGMVEVAADIAFSAGAADAARAALRAGAPIFTDAEMVARGVTRARLPANNDVLCTLTDPRVPDMAAASRTTRSASAMDLWRDRLGGAIVAIGNAPTSLYRLLEMLDEGAPMPACVIGMPVGFVGAAESKEALMLDGRVPYIVVRGRKGGSAMAAAAVNALASDRE